MMKVFVLVLLATSWIQSFAADSTQEDPVYAYTIEGPDGKPYPLSQHQGQVVLLVNVASRCGFTKQYAGLQALFAKYKDRGFTVIGVPANDFGAQEPGTNVEIQQFCSATYNVTFPVVGKAHVKGAQICPLYQYLTTKSPKPGDITWNFNKFLIARDGSVIDRYESKITPDDVGLNQAIEKALSAAK
jgi:glutathione peroxidase